MTSDDSTPAPSTPFRAHLEDHEHLHTIVKTVDMCKTPQKIKDALKPMSLRRVWLGATDLMP